MPDVTSGQGDLWFSKKERIFSWQDRSKDKAIPLIVKSHPAIGSTLQVPSILSAVNLGATHSRGMSLFLPDLRCESPHIPCPSPEMMQAAEGEGNFLFRSKLVLKQNFLLWNDQIWNTSCVKPSSIWVSPTLNHQAVLQRAIPDLSCTSEGCVGTCLPQPPAFPCSSCTLCDTHPKCGQQCLSAAAEPLTPKVLMDREGKPTATWPFLQLLWIYCTKEDEATFLILPVPSLLKPHWAFPSVCQQTRKCFLKCSLLHKNSLFAYGARDAALGMLSSHSKHSMTTIQATGAESLEGGREAKEKKNIFSGCLECYKLCFIFSFPNVTESCLGAQRNKQFPTWPTLLMRYW